MLLIVIWHMLANAILEWSEGGISIPSFLMSGALEGSGKILKGRSGVRKGVPSEKIGACTTLVACYGDRGHERGSRNIQNAF